jgi:hypothetical protein
MAKGRSDEDPFQEEPSCLPPLFILALPLEAICETFFPLSRVNQKFNQAHTQTKLEETLLAGTYIVSLPSGPRGDLMPPYTIRF